MGGATHLAAYSDASPAANRAFAAAYCRQRGTSFVAAGAVRRGVLPQAAAAAAGAAALTTYCPATKATCAGAACPLIAVVECVPAGAAPCQADEAGNVG